AARRIRERLCALAHHPFGNDLPITQPSVVQVRPPERPRSGGRDGHMKRGCNDRRDVTLPPFALAEVLHADRTRDRCSAAPVRGSPAPKMSPDVRCRYIVPRTLKSQLL